MPSSGFTKRFWPFAFIRRKRLPDCICSEEEFRRILACERARVDRGGQMFSLVIFDIGNAAASRMLSRHLQRLLVSRLRSGDEIGWIDARHIGAILPNAAPDGAWRFAITIRETISPICSPPRCYVYAYPNEYRDKDDGNITRPKDRFPEALPDTSGTGSDAPDQFISPLHSDPIPMRNCAKLPVHLLSGCRLPLWKRWTDIGGALLGLVISSPMLLLVSLMIRTVSSGPVLFRQERIGYGGTPFTLLKFRTMKSDADILAHRQHLSRLIKEGAEKPMTKLDDDARIIPFGRILRKLCIDELPQLINVLRGEMSLVGPRPPIPYEVDEYLKWHNGRLDVVPGMTGLWQVSGKNRLTFKEMVRLDIRYARCRSFWLDLKILLMTPVAIFLQVRDCLNRKKEKVRGVAEHV
ncbi:sugar transferase [Desulfonema ishimotonii]|uniref:Sugar transferase n=1 Tax=Desulfonema ishimotonii TaxID=45657 RepID=A0A401G3H9_9BACT|nr:sugar transferase [Desulfonema ishimotonii]GBC63774.1 sugar transferase [Desulfonema ishimotonii]